MALIAAAFRGNEKLMIMLASLTGAIIPSGTGFDLCDLCTALKLRRFSAKYEPKPIPLGMTLGCWRLPLEHSGCRLRLARQRLRLGAGIFGGTVVLAVNARKSFA